MYLFYLLSCILFNSPRAGEARLQSEFPQMSHFEISCALEVAGNDVDTALEVLTMMKEE